jgi:23S rRNA pseudouridine955/2504/2580 synthase
MKEAKQADRAIVPAVLNWTVDEDQAGQRIDNYLLARLKGVPKTRIYKMLRTGEVRVNGGRVANDYRLEPEDRLRIPPVRVASGTSPTSAGQAQGHVSPAKAMAIAKKIQTVFSDEVMLAINKPFGIAVHGGSGVSLGVIEALRQQGDALSGAALRPAESARPVFLELVHRLDRETSGVMLLAKRRSALTEFHRQLRDGGMRKRYLALVWGCCPSGQTQIDAPLLKWVNAKGERWVRVDPSGQTALTRVRCLQTVEHPVMGTVSLVLCEPVTGRTHQLRVHLASQGLPIMGDPKYGDHAREKELLTALGSEKASLLCRMFLHAWQLRCSHPISHETMQLQANLDQSFDAMVDELLIDRSLCKLDNL